MRRIGIRHLWILVPFFALAVRARLPIGDNSFLWHVRAGIDQLRAGEVLRSDPYSFTMVGEPWRTQSWMADLIYGLAENTFGDLSWVPWFGLIAGSLVIGVIVVLLVSRGGSLASVAAGAILFGWIIQPYANPRPVLLSYLFFALMAVVVASRGRHLWAVPGLLWLWAAVHGSFVIGGGILVLDALRLGSRRHLRVIALSLVTVSLTAHGFGVWEILYRFATNREGLDFIVEWQPPNFQNPWLFPFIAILGILMVGFAGQRIPVRDLWIILPMVAFALTSSRNVLPGVILLMPWVADAMAPFRADDQVPRGDLLATGTAVVIVTLGLLMVALPNDLDEERFPSDQAVAALDGGPVFHTMGPGGYLIYAESDSFPVFVDDRVELYGAEFLGEYLDAAFGITWTELFEEWEIHQALLEHDSDLIQGLERDGWSTCYADDYFSVLAESCR